MRTIEEIENKIKELQVLSSDLADNGDFNGYRDYEAQIFALKWVLKRNGYNI
jgi:hypothetical protein